MCNRTKAHLHYNLLKRLRKAPTGLLHATTVNLCRGKTDRAVKETENIFIARQRFEVFTTFFYSEQQTFDLRECINNERKEYWSIQISTIYDRVV